MPPLKGGRRSPVNVFGPLLLVEQTRDTVKYKWFGYASPGQRVSARLADTPPRSTLAVHSF
jgi:hypothetical protein